MNCKCLETDEIIGASAKTYARDHLEKISTDPQTWEIKYICRETNIVWILDYPNSEHHGGGIPRLRKLEKESIDS